MGRSIGWSAIGVDGEERRRKEGEGKRQGKDRKKTGERQEKDRGETGKKAGFCKVIDTKTGCLGKK